MHWSHEFATGIDLMNSQRNTCIMYLMHSCTIWIIKNFIQCIGIKFYTNWYHWSQEDRLATPPGEHTTVDWAGGTNPGPIHWQCAELEGLAPCLIFWSEFVVGMLSFHVKLLINCWSVVTWKLLESSTVDWTILDLEKDLVDNWHGSTLQRLERSS
jgi:hypothetical protein